MSIWIGPYQLISHGVPLSFNRDKVSSYMSDMLKSLDNESSINIKVLIGDGPFKSLAWGCDLSEEYIKINSEYTT